VVFVFNFIVHLTLNEQHTKVRTRCNLMIVILKCASKFKTIHVSVRNSWITRGPCFSLEASDPTLASWSAWNSDFCGGKFPATRPQLGKAGKTFLDYNQWLFTVFQDCWSVCHCRDSYESCVQTKSFVLQQKNGIVSYFHIKRERWE